jgi:raffinose/stachyose/melibiose transport system substrate-binding protein
MNRSTGRSITRRSFLKLAGTGVAAAGMGPLLQACAPAATPAPAAAPAATQAPAATEAPAATSVPPTAVPPTAVPPTAAPATAAPAAAASGQTLNMWWWGEQEAPGLEKWLKDSIDQYKQKTGNVINPTLQSNDTVVPEFQTASAAKKAPDIQYFWNGLYHMESVWLGYMEPLNGLIPDDLLKASNATILSVFQGKQYRLGWYSASPLWLYNKDMFDKAGLDADKPPTTWEDFKSACDKLKSKGFTPMMAGLKDGPWGEWYMGHGLGPNLDSPAEALNLFAGELDWNEPKYYQHWDKLAEMWKAGYFNDDMNSVDLYPGIDMWAAGKGAMTAIVTPLLRKLADQLGPEKVGLMVFPIGGSGKMNGRPIADTQGIGLSAQSQHKDVAADFLKFLHTDERVNALWSEVKAIPVDSTWDGKNQIKEKLYQDLWAGWVVNPDAVPYISNLMPTLFWTDAMFVNSQKIIAGEYTGAQAGANAQAVAQKWREQNPDLLEKYKVWANDLKL